MWHCWIIIGHQFWYIIAPENSQGPSEFNTCKLFDFSRPFKGLGSVGSKMPFSGQFSLNGPLQFNGSSDSTWTSDFKGALAATACSGGLSVLKRRTFSISSLSRLAAVSRQSLNCSRTVRYHRECSNWTQLFKQVKIVKETGTKLKWQEVLALHA